MAGGGGQIDSQTPEYLRKAHYQMVHGSTTSYESVPKFGLLEAVDVAISGSSPYLGETAYDPDGELDDIEDKIDSFETIVNAMNEQTKWESLSDKAVAVTDETGSEVFDLSTDYMGSLSAAITTIISASTTALANATITNEVASFQSNAETRLATAKSRLGAGMADINAVHSSAFAMAEAMIEAEVGKDVNAYESKMKVDLYNQIIQLGIKGQLDIIIRKAMARDAYVSQAVIEMNKIYIAQLSLQDTMTEKYRMFNTNKIVAKKEENRENIEMDVNDAMWDVKIFQGGANVLAAGFGGVAAGGGDMTPTQSGLSGAASGAALGAQVSGGNPWGAVIGGAVGLIGGIVSANN